MDNHQIGAIAGNCVRCGRLIRTDGTVVPQTPGGNDHIRKNQVAYTRVSESLPPEGELVDTISEGGIEQPLKRLGRLWLVPDGGMYVYYTPILWRQRHG